MAVFGRNRAPFQRRTDGMYDVRLDDDVRRLIGQLLAQLSELLHTDNPALSRLFPPPYGDDEERNRGYAALAGSELVEGKLAAIDTVEESLDATEMDEETLTQWMSSINDLRLVLGTILNVTEDQHHVDSGSQDAATFAAYELLGAVLEGIVWALSD